MEAIISFTIRENGEDDDDEDVDDNAGRDSLFSLAERRGGSSLAVFRSPRQSSEPFEALITPPVLSTLWPLRPNPHLIANTYRLGARNLSTSALLSSQIFSKSVLVVHHILS